MAIDVRSILPLLPEMNLSREKHMFLSHSQHKEHASHFLSSPTERYEVTVKHLVTDLLTSKEADQWQPLEQATDLTPSYQQRDSEVGTTKARSTLGCSCLLYISDSPRQILQVAASATTNCFLVYLMSKQQAHTESLTQIICCQTEIKVRIEICLDAIPPSHSTLNQSILALIPWC